MNKNQITAIEETLKGRMISTILSIKDHYKSIDKDRTEYEASTYVHYRSNMSNYFTGIAESLSLFTNLDYNWSTDDGKNFFLVITTHNSGIEVDRIEI